MEYAVIFFGLLSIGCTCMIFVIINTYNKKISDVQKATAKIHLKMMEIESSFKSIVQKNRESNRKTNSFSRGKEIIYRIPKKIFGDLVMDHDGNRASVKATLKVEKVDD